MGDTAMIDARNFSFIKYHLPKTDSLLSSSMDIAVGFFDSVDVKKINNKKCQNSIDGVLKSYYSTISKNFPEQENSRQNIFAFTNVEENEKFEEDKFSFSQKKLLQFWKNETVTFFSLLHINFKTKSDMTNLLYRLNKLFNNNSEKYNAVFYFSFDYSDIIVCAKNLSVTEFTKNIFEATYGNTELDTAVIKDSFSMITLNKHLAENAFKIIRNNPTNNYFQLKKELDNLIYRRAVQNDKLLVSYNIGIQQIETYQKFKKELENKQIPYKSFQMLGRHDITVYSDESVSLSWLLIIMYFIDKYSTEQENIKTDDVLFNCEAFVRVNNENEDCGGQRAIPKYESSLYYNAKEEIDKHINSIRLIANNQSVTLPMEALLSFRNSILGTFKNGFADDFIACVYEPYIAFLVYIEKYLVNDYKNKCNDDVFNDFFDTISALLNSAMHSDRQFIQAPSFSPVFFDVPPKLLALYTSMANSIVKINKDSEDKSKYSFIFRPNFSKNISVSIYSYPVNPPTDRLLMIKINEKSLYKINNVIMTLCHEIAHYVGVTQRIREKRKELFIKANLFYTIKLLLLKDLTTRNLVERYDGFDNELAILVKDVYEIISNYSFYKDNDGYSDNLNQLMYISYYSLSKNKEVNLKLRKFLNKIQDKLNEDLCEEKQKININISYAATTLFERLVFICKHLKKDITISQPYFNEKYIAEAINFYKDIKNAFSEIYADIQMVLLMGLTAKEYVDSFIVELNEKAKQLVQTKKTYYRILNITNYFSNIGVWSLEDISHDEIDDKVSKDDKEVKSLLDSIYYSQNKHPTGNTKQMSDEFYTDFRFTKKQIINRYSVSQKIASDGLETYINMILKDYIESVVENTYCVYKQENKFELVYEFRKKISKIVGSNDSVEIFNEIQESNEQYLKEILNIVE